MAATAGHHRILVAVTLLQMVVAALLLPAMSQRQGWSAVHGEDSAGYLLVARHFAGEPIGAADVPLLRYRLFNPLVPALAALLGTVFGLEAAFLILNALLWVGAVLLMAALGRQVDDDRTGFLAAVFLATALPMIEWALPIMVDAAAYFVALLFVLLFLRWRQRGLGWALALGGILGTAMLVKPTLAGLGLFAALAWGAGRRFAPTLVAGAAALAMVGGWYLLAGLTLDDFSGFGQPRHRGVVLLVSAAVFCFHWGWWLALRGWRHAAAERSTLVFYLVGFLVTFLPFIHSPRLFFLAFPAVLVLAARGARDVARSAASPERAERRLAIGYALTSNVLAVVHLGLTRVLSIREVDQLIGLFS